MNRRTFINRSVQAGLLLSLPTWVSCSQSRFNFGVCTDVHKDVIPDADARLQEFIDYSIKNEARFILQAGDFCHPKKENDNFMKIWNGFSGPKYHILGNHDLDISGKAETMAYWGMEKPYYSFIYEGLQFIILDANFLKINGKYSDFENANYFQHPRESGTFIPEEQMDWLEKTLAENDMPALVFCHQSLENPFGVKNGADVRRILENTKPEKIAACFNGHHHIDYQKVINNIPYIHLNSMSYHWVGKEYEYKRYSEEEHAKHPTLKDVIPYDRSLFALFTLDPNKKTLRITGRAGNLAQPPLAEIGHSGLSECGVKLTAKISDRELTV